jgi:hypothetical protein
MNVGATERMPNEQMDCDVAADPLPHSRTIACRESSE